MLFNILIYLVYNQNRAIITITNMFSMYFKDSVINLIILLVLLIIKKIIILGLFLYKNLNLADNINKILSWL